MSCNLKVWLSWSQLLPWGQSLKIWDTSLGQASYRAWSWLHKGSSDWEKRYFFHSQAMQHTATISFQVDVASEINYWLKATIDRGNNQDEDRTDWIKDHSNNPGSLKAQHRTTKTILAQLWKWTWLLFIESLSKHAVRARHKRDVANSKQSSWFNSAKIRVNSI